MKSVDRILTQHPDGKRGVNIAVTKYETMRDAILAQLGLESVSFGAFYDEVVGSLKDFDGSPAWYFETVKLDLEARRLIEHDRKLRTIRRLA